MQLSRPSHLAARPTSLIERTVPRLQKVIRDAGFVPVERDTLYRRVERDGRRWKAI